MVEKTTSAWPCESGMATQMQISRPERSWLTSSWLETRPAANLRSEDCVGRERKRETSVCICEIEKVRNWKLTNQQIP